jgi:hypothetical protein
VVALKTNATVYQNCAPVFHDFANHSRINFDGLLVANDSKTSEGYSQLYRSGIIETTDTTFISAADSHGMGKIISTLPFEVRLFRSVRRFLSVLKSLGVDPPFTLMLSLIDVQGYTMSRHDDLNPFGGGAPFDRSVLMPQDVLIDTYSSDVPLVMKPLVDELWNAAGFNGSAYYKDDKWLGEELARRIGGR